MAFYFGLSALPAGHRCVAVIGNFDGVHKGHQSVLRQARAQAQARGLPLTAVVFEPQPREYFAPAHSPLRLTRLREKRFLLERYAVDTVWCLRFGPRLAGMDAVDFVQDIVLRALGARALVAGGDFRFGRDRGGDFSLLRRLTEAAGCSVIEAEEFTMDGERVSSSAVRRLLAAGELSRVNALLGHSFRVSGRVIPGRQRGRSLGFPTANIRLHRHQTLPHGVFVARAGLESVPLAPALIWLGGAAPSVLEVHLLANGGDLYGRRLYVEWLDKLRDDAVFDDDDALLQRMREDLHSARSFLGGVETR